MSRQRNCRRCQRPVETCSCGDALSTAEGDAGLLPFSLSVNSKETPLGLGGYDRPIARCENADEVIARYREVRQPTIYCAYCENSIRVLNVADAIAWFRTHKCAGEGTSIDDWQAA